jgi:glycosyltransferase involved in cell wall biosynthesis
MQKKISIVTIVYNGVNLIEQTIQSVLNNSDNVNLEYIVIDGGSTDGTLDVINKFVDSIDIFVSEKDGGIFDAINKGIRLANGNYIGLIHCGDLLNANSLNLVVSAFIKNDCDIVFGDIIFHEVDGDLSYERYLKADLSNIKNSMSIFHPSVFVKSEIYKEIGLFRLDLPVASDYEFILRAYLSGYKFSYLNYPLTIFKTGGNSGSRYWDSLNDYFKIYKFHISFFWASRVIFKRIVISNFFILRRNLALYFLGESYFLSLKKRKYNKLDE